MRLQQHVIQRRLAFRRRPEDVDGDAARICSRISQRHAADNLTIGRVDHGIECGGGLGAIHVCVVEGVLLFLADLAGHRPSPVGTEHIDLAVKPAGKIERVEEGLRLARRGLFQHLAIEEAADTGCGQRLLNGRAQEGVGRTDCIVTEFIDFVIVLVVRLDVGALRPDIDIVGQFIIGAAKHLRVDQLRLERCELVEAAFAAALDRAGARRGAVDERGQHAVGGEVLVDQRVGRLARAAGQDLAPERGVADAGVEDRSERIGRSAGALGGIDITAPRPHQLRHDAGIVHMLDRTHQVQAAEGLAAGNAVALDEIVTIGGQAGLSVDLQAFKLLVHDEVDDTGDGVRPVNRRGTAGDDIDAADQHLRDLVDVVDRQTLAVEQHQRALSADRAQVQTVGARVAAGVAGVALLRRQAGKDRQLVKGIRQDAWRGLQQIGRAHCGQRRRTDGPAIQQARTGDDHFGSRRIGFLGSSYGGRSRLSGLRPCSRHKCDHAGTSQHRADDRILHSGSPPKDNKGILP